MANGMRYWIGLVALGSLGIAAWKLPPTSMVRHANGEMTPEEARERDLRRDIRRSHDVLQRTRWGDSLTALILEKAVDNVWVDGAPALLQAAVLDSVGVRIREELGRARIDESKAVVGFFVQPRSHAGLGRVPRDTRGGPPELYMGSANGRAYCYRVLATPNPVSFNNSEIRRSSWTEDIGFSNLLGGCRVVAQHGLPGPSVLAWLQRGALGFAHQPAFGPTRLAAGRGVPLPSPFGRTVPSWVNDLEMDRCVAGIPSACEVMILDPLTHRGELEADVLHVVERSPVSSMGRAVFASPFGSADDYLFADLAMEFGDERFAAFWTSDEEVPEAFEAAFGLTLGEWVVSWSASRFPRTPPGPRLSSTTTSGTLLLMTLCALMAGAVMRRRRVG